MDDPIVNNCTNSILTSLEQYTIFSKSKVKTVRHKPVRFFDMDDGNFGVLSHCSSRFVSIPLDAVSPVDIAYFVYSKAAADITGTTAKSSYAFFSLGLPDGRQDDYITKVQEGLYLAARMSGAQFIGGDLYKSEEPALDVILYGSLSKKTHLMKKTLKSMYNIYITGNPGDSYAGSQLIQNQGRPLKYEKTLINRFLKPEMYSKVINPITDELQPVFISNIHKSIVDILYSIQANTMPGFTFLYHSFPVSREMLQYHNNDRLEAFKTAVNNPAPNELIIITPETEYTNEYIDDVRISLIGRLTQSDYYIETHNGKKPFNPRKLKSYAV